MPEVITRRDAFTLGRTTFYTGRVCKWGHTVERFVSSGACVQCNRETSRMFARAQHGGSVRVMFEHVHPDDAAVLHQTYVMLQATRDAANTARPADIAAARQQAYGTLADPGAGYAPPPFEPHPGAK